LELNTVDLALQAKLDNKGDKSLFYYRTMQN
jgi:hypothetical protein